MAQYLHFRILKFPLNIIEPFYDPDLWAIGVRNPTWALPGRVGQGLFLTRPNLDRELCSPPRCFVRNGWVAGGCWDYD